MITKSPVIGSTKDASDLGLPRFSPGQMLYHNDLSALAEYTQHVTQLVLRSLFGCGVVCGLCVNVSFKCNKLTVVVDPGVALDCEGNLIHVTKPATIVIDPECVIDSFDSCLWVVLRGYQKCCAPRVSMCSCDEDEVVSAPTREQYCYEIQVRTKPPECVCACLEPDDRDCKEMDVEIQDVADDEAPGEGEEAPGGPCQCADPQQDCYEDHYSGKCACGCAGAGECKDCCDWILLARLIRKTHVDEAKDKTKVWMAEHRYRRFVRPVLMRDPGCGESQRAVRQTDKSEGTSRELAAEGRTQKRSSAPKSRKARGRST